MESKIFNKLDIYISYTLILLSIILLIILFTIFPTLISRYISAPIFLLFINLIYIIYFNKIQNKSNYFDLENLKMDKKITNLYNILFFTILVICNLLIIANSKVYSRPIFHFILISFVISLLGIEILSMDKKINYKFIIIKIIIISFYVRLIPQTIFPDLIGIDPFWHKMMSDIIYISGRIPEGFNYSNIPLMHLIISISQILTNLDYKYAAFFSIGIIQLIIIIFIFYISKKYLNLKIALLAGLLIGISDVSINSSTIIIPLSIGIVFITMLLYISIIKYNNNLSKNIILIFLPFTAILLTHILAAIFFIIIYMIILLSIKIYKVFNGIKKPFKMSSLFFLFIIVEFISFFIYVTSSFSEQIIISVREGLSSSGGGFSIQSSSYSYIEIFEIFLDEFGFFLFISLAIFGSLYLLSKNKINTFNFSLVNCGFFFIFIIFFSQVFGLLGLLPGRWYQILQVLTVIQSAIGIILIHALISPKKRKIIISIFLIIFGFFMITNPISNFDTPIYSKNTTSRLALTNSEILSFNCIESITDNNTLIVDQFPSYYLGYIKKIRTKDLSPYLLNKDFYKIKSGLILIRQEIIIRPFGAYEEGIININYDPNIILNRLKFNKIFESNSINLYFKV